MDIHDLDLTLIKQQLQKILGREVEVERLRTGKFICQYVNYYMSPASLVGDTETEAYQKLLAYLQSQRKSDPDAPTIA